MKLLDFYAALLRDCYVWDDDGEGLLTGHYAGKTQPITVEKQRLALPIPELLRNPKEGVVVFHPMSEKINRGESPILKALKDYMLLRSQTVLINIMRTLMDTAASPETHKKLGPKVAEYLKKVPEVDEKTVTALNKVLAAAAPGSDPNKRLISYYLKHGSTGEDDFARTCVVSFPIEDDFESTEKTIFGVTMRPKDKDRIKALLDYVMGDADDRKQYTFGSKNLDAPYFHSLANAFYKVSVRLNQILEKHKKQFPNFDELHMDLSWAEGLDNFAMYRGLIPSQDGNEGAPIPEEPNAEEKLAAFSRESVDEPKKDALSDLVDEQRPTSRRPSPSEARETRDERRPASRSSESTGASQSLSDFFAHRDEEQRGESRNRDSWGSARTREQDRRDTSRGNSWSERFADTSRGGGRRDFEERYTRFDNDRRGRGRDRFV